MIQVLKCAYKWQNKEQSFSCILKRNETTRKGAQAQLQVKLRGTLRLSCREYAVTKQKLLTGICGAFGDGEIRAWTPRSALIILLAFPTVWTCSVVLTFTGQFAVVIHTHSGMEITFAPRQRRDKSSLLSQIDLGDHYWDSDLEIVFTQLSPRVVVLIVGSAWVLPKDLLKCGFAGPTLRIFLTSVFEGESGVMIQPDLIPHFVES